MSEKKFSTSTSDSLRSAPELCDFLGAFGSGSRRWELSCLPVSSRFKHCRVLHGRNSEEYLIALLMTSPQDEMNSLLLTLPMI